jgi:hypothetical protein
MTGNELAAPDLNFVFEARVAVGPPQDLGEGRPAHRADHRWGILRATDERRSAGRRR